MPSATMLPGSGSRTSWSTRTRWRHPTATRWEAKRPLGSTSRGSRGSACRALTIAHVRGDSGKFPERPFGSVFVHNLARETWAVERLGDDDPEAIDPDEIRFGPDVVSLELRNKKANARPKSAAQFVTFSFFPDGSIEVVTDGPAGRSVADLAADALADGPLTLPKIAAAIKEDTGQVVSVENIRSAVARHPRRFAQDKSGKRPYPWSVR